jgi:aminodeoxychorismate lyase
MVVFLNGQFVPEKQAVVSAFDRGFLYGDGLFETLRVVNGVPFRWRQHLERLQRGAEVLKIALPFGPAALSNFAARLLKKNRLKDALLRVHLSRGRGLRGYSPRRAERPTVVMSLHEPPKLHRRPPLRWRLITSSIRLLANDPLAQFKTCNRLPHILARAEAERAGADEALLLNNNGLVAEASTSNVFCIQQGAVCTPPLPSGILPGVTRAVILELCQSLGLRSRESRMTPRQIFKADGVFLSLSSLGVVETIALDGRRIPRSPVTTRIRLAYLELLRCETAD